MLAGQTQCPDPSPELDSGRSEGRLFCLKVGGRILALLLFCAFVIGLAYLSSWTAMDYYSRNGQGPAAGVCAGWTLFFIALTIALFLGGASLLEPVLEEGEDNVIAGAILGSGVVLIIVVWVVAMVNGPGLGQWHLIDSKRTAYNVTALSPIPDGAIYSSVQFVSQPPQFVDTARVYATQTRYAKTGKVEIYCVAPAVQSIDQEVHLTNFYVFARDCCTPTPGCGTCPAVSAAPSTCSSCKATSFTCGEWSEARLTAAIFPFPSPDAHFTVALNGLRNTSSTGLNLTQPFQFVVPVPSAGGIDAYKTELVKSAYNLLWQVAVGAPFLVPVAALVIWAVVERKSKFRGR